MRRVVLVTGPPCAGKTTFVAAHSEPGDTILDRDVMARYTRHPEQAMRKAITKVAASRDGTAWVIRCVPDAKTREQLATQLHADEMILLLPPRQTLNARAMQRPDPPGTFASIDRWFEHYTPSASDTVIADAPEQAPTHPAAPYAPTLAW